MKNTSQYPFYLKSLIQGDQKACERIIQELLLSKMSIKDLYLNYLQAAMYEIGTLWQENKISIAGEHVASAITEAIINQISPIAFEPEKNGKRALITCVSDEQHQIGAKMIADFLELRGWDTDFAGPETNLDDLIVLLKNDPPHLVGLSITTTVHLQRLFQILNKLVTEFSELKIIVGGQALNFSNKEIFLKYSPHVRPIFSAKGFDDYLDEENIDAAA